MTPNKPLTEKDSIDVHIKGKSIPESDFKVFCKLNYTKAFFKSDIILALELLKEKNNKSFAKLMKFFEKHKQIVSPKMLHLINSFRHNPDKCFQIKREK